jgi:phosphopantetheinyl transferase (holo-ACP synthase)
MIGNDIVDRVQAKRESNWQRKGFLDKLFTTDEQRLILTASDPERIVWTLWSMKESAYKVAVRETGKRVFAPRKLECQVNTLTEETAEGVVSYEKIYQTRSSITPHYIASVAVPTNLPFDFHQEISLLNRATYQHQHVSIEKRIKQYCSASLSIPDGNSFLQKDQAGNPALTLIKSSGKQLTIPISISHHGYYGSFAISYIHGL